MLGSPQILHLCDSCDILEDIDIDTDHRPILATFRTTPSINPTILEQLPIHPLLSINYSNNTDWLLYDNNINQNIPTLTDESINSINDIESLSTSIIDIITNTALESFPPKITQRKRNPNPLLNDHQYGKLVKLTHISVSIFSIIKNHPDFNSPSPQIASILPKINNFQLNITKYNEQFTIPHIPLIKPYINLQSLLIHVQQTQHRINHIKRIISQKINSYHVNKIVENIKKNVIQDDYRIFSLLNPKKREHPSRIITFNNHTPTIITDPSLVKDGFKQYWQTIFTNPSISQPNISNFLINTPKSDKNYTCSFTPQEILTSLQSINKSSPGQDGISYKLLQHSIKNSPTLLQHLSILYNKCITLNYLPRDWRSSITILLKKSPSSDSLDNWRPICLLSTIYKTYTNIINQKLMNILLNENLIPPSQNGFINNREVSQCIRPILHIIEDANINKKPLHIAYIDLVKAFDSTNHNTLLQILNHMNLHNFSAIVKTLLSNSSTSITTAHGPTDPIEITRGVHQGDVISPLLFIIFLNPLLWTIHHTTIGYSLKNVNISISAFADDLVLTNSDPLELQKSFNHLTDYCTQSNIFVSQTKSAYTFSPHTLPISPPLPISILKSDEPYKYLGIWITASLNWSHQLQQSSNTFKLSVIQILKKFYLNSNQHIRLINAVTNATIGYRMQFILFPTLYINNLNKFTINSLAHTHHISQNLDS